MTSRDFCYWLQGFIEMTGSETLSPHQTGLLKRHLDLVFVHDIDAPDPTGDLQAAHDGVRPKPLAGGVKRC